MKCIKKTISPLLTKRAAKLYYRVRKEDKKDNSVVHNTIAKTINGAISITAYGRQTQDKKFIDTLKTFEPKTLEHSKETLNRVQSMIGAEGPYRPMKRFETLPDACKAILIAAFQIADFDFFTDGNHKSLFVNKQHFSNPQLVSVRKFIVSKTKFIIGKSTKDADKQAVALLSAIYNLSATAIVVNRDALMEKRIKDELLQVVAGFSELFPKTHQQI